MNLKGTRFASRAYCVLDEATSEIAYQRKSPRKQDWTPGRREERM